MDKTGQHLIVVVLEEMEEEEEAERVAQALGRLQVQADFRLEEDSLVLEEPGELECPPAPLQVAVVVVLMVPMVVEDGLETVISKLQRVSEVPAELRMVTLA
jgi:hypothetical protein